MNKLSDLAKMWLDKLHNFINATAHAELSAAVDRLAAYESLGPVEELTALKEAAERIVLMWDNCYIEPYSADVKDYIERMRKAIKEADHDE